MHSPMKSRARNLWGEKKIEGFVGRVLDETGKCMINKTLGRALDPRANSTWLSKLTE